MSNTSYLLTLIQATDEARSKYRLSGSVLDKLFYESNYMALGRLALNASQTEVKCPAALDAMYRLAINAV